MYKCSVCKTEVIVDGVEKPIRGCNCTQEVIVNGEKVTKPSTIITDMGDVKLKGHGLFNN
jgi:hypothetical protein